ncbi:TAXI family TRAP transporter solute-binding subunit [Rhodoplanes sp. TEM]|uniref:TAXI family TRAP transporter solute-binding subunit n=1 Tax=Rhodoplanes TaxID=29407 RepID=UPI002350011D|nr:MULTISPECIES: TAXI family TRAP transporter solute-binding subunit [Rhodoplanes]MDC7988156.1 TAXI family TRAP transporter solute-binding subunit [Rhodoplanes sp. TEM]MDQ0355671.1 TRAP transporter TAXI family solute receptor [Rhodoplanes tepidamans]
MDEGLQRACWWHACSRVLTAAAAAAAFFAMIGLGLATVPSAAAQASPPRAAAEVSQAVGSAGRPRSAPRRSTGEPALGPLAEQANADTLTIVADGVETTALAAAADVAAVIDGGEGLRVLPIAGRGGGQAIRDVRLLKGVDLGIAPATALGLLQRSNAIGRIDDKISVVTKLFNEEIHVVVRTDSPAGTVADLAGKPVALGETGSATALTAGDVFDKLGVAVDGVNLPGADALEKLRAGEIAAAVLVSGKPAAAMARLPAGTFRLLPLDYAKPLQADYLPARLTADDYPGLVAPDAAVATVAVGTVLFAPTWPKGSERYKRIERFVGALFPKLAELQKRPRHPKWLETSLAATVPGWSRFPAAEEWLRRNAPPTQISREQFERFLASRRVAADDAATTVDREKLFQEFLRWNETRERR